MPDYSITQFITKTSYCGAKDFHKTTTNAETLPEILEAFERHLKGTGFVFDGYLDFVDDEGFLIEKRS